MGAQGLKVARLQIVAQSHGRLSVTFLSEIYREFRLAHLHAAYARNHPLSAPPSAVSARNTMANFAILAVITIAAGGLTHSITAPQVPVPPVANGVLTGLAELGMTPEIKAVGADENGVIDGTLKIGTGNSFIDLPDLKFDVPAQVEKIVEIVKGVTGSAPSVTIDVKIIEVAPVAAEA